MNKRSGESCAPGMDAVAGAEPLVDQGISKISPQAGHPTFTTPVCARRQGATASNRIDCKGVRQAIPFVCLPRHLARRTLLSLLIAMLLLPRAALTAHAQILTLPPAPGALRPTILAAPNGVPLVNIQTPSAAGVSRNLYSQFDVGANGAILNNSRLGANTQIGGAVPGNPWLQNGTARVIVNEVYSNDPSRLNGPVEVAGDRAQVVIANPSGIQVDGGRFINAAGVTLTTGIPQFDALGNLERYAVRGGKVQINGAGFDVTLPDGRVQRVLVPQLYVRTRAGDIDGSGSLIAGEQVIARGVEGAGELVNRGIIAGRRLVSIEADGMAAMFGSIGAAIAGYDAVQINQAGTAAATAAANNSLMHYPQKALQKLGEVLKSLELQPLVQSQQAIREYLEAAGARGGLSEMEVAALATLYAANEALFPTSVLDILPGSGRAIGQSGKLIKAGVRAQEAAAVAAKNVSSRIGESPRLIKEAESAGRSHQESLDRLVDQLRNGNTNPGIGTKPIGSGLSEARARDGARVYFRETQTEIEILGKSSKANQETVIKEVLRVFGN